MSSILLLCDPNFNVTEFRAEENQLTETLGALSDYSLLTHPYLSSLISGLGIFGNFMLFIVLSRPSMLQHGGHGSVHAILAAIAVADFFTNLTNFVYLLVRLLISRSCDVSAYYDYAWNLFVLIHADCSVFLHAASLYLTVALALLRVLVLCYHSKRWLNEISTGYWSILVTTVLVLVLSFPNFLRNVVDDVVADKVHYRCSNGTMVSVEFSQANVGYRISTPTWWNCPLEKFSFWTNGVMCKIIPCLLLTIFMACLLQIIFVARQRRQRLLITSASASSDASTQASTQADRTTALLVSIVFIFWLTELPQGVLLILSAFNPSLFTVYQLFGDVLDLLSLINSSVNFALYCSMSAKFRQEFVALLSCNYYSSNSDSPNPPAMSALKKRYAVSMNMDITAKHSARNTENNSVSVSLLNKTRCNR